MPRQQISSFTGLAVDRDGTVTDMCDATGTLYNVGTAIPATAAQMGGILCNPVGTRVRYLYRANADYGNVVGGAGLMTITQATIKKVMAISVCVHGTSASLVKGNAWFSWAQSVASPTSNGSTLRIYGWRGASGISAATRPASIAMMIVGT